MNIAIVLMIGVALCAAGISLIVASESKALTAFGVTLGSLALACAVLIVLLKIFGEHIENSTTDVVRRELEGVSTQQYISADGEFGLFHGYITAQTNDKYRYYYKEEDGSIRSSVADMSQTTIRYTDEKPMVDIRTTTTEKDKVWLIFHDGKYTETSYEYNFYVPEGSVIQSYTFN